MVDRREYLNELEETVRMAMDERLKEVWTTMPAIIQSFNATAMTCVAQVAIQSKITNIVKGTSQMVSIYPCVDCPAVFVGGGGLTLTFPVKQGDECLLFFAKSCIDAWWQQGGVQPPAEYRMHDLSDGFALVGVRSQPRVLTGGVSTTKAQLRNDAGTLMIEVDPVADKINLTAAGGVFIAAAGGLWVNGVEVIVP